MSDFDPYMKDGYKIGGQQTLLKPHEETQREELPEWIRVDGGPKYIREDLCTPKPGTDLGPSAEAQP